MINYIWLGFLVVSIGYAAYLDVSKAPMSYTPPPLVLALPAPDGELAQQADADAATEAATDPSSDATAEDAEEAPARPVVLAYDFASGDSVVLPFASATPIAYDEKEGVRPASVKLTLRADGSGHRLFATVRDADGEAFVAEAGSRLEEYGDAVSVAFAFDAFKPTGETDDGAKLNFPVTLRALELQRVRSSTFVSGSIAVTGAEATYGKHSYVGYSTDAKRWMGVATGSAARWAEISINLAFGLIGLMMLWLGLMRIAEEAGLVRLLARLLKPIMVWLFPELPADGDAMGAILMNVAANMLGLGNAATPLGIKAMEEMQAVNPRPEYASNAQCMLLAINTSSVTLIPATIISFRAAAGSVEIVKFLPVMIAVTFISTVVAVTACKLLEKMPVFAIPADARKADWVKEDAQ